MTQTCASVYKIRKREERKICLPPQSCLVSHDEQDTFVSLGI